MTDIPLEHLQLVWDYQGSRRDAPVAKCLDIRTGRDDRDYLASWGACDLDFKEASRSRRRLMLFLQFHRLVTVFGYDAMAVHQVLLDVPEYREALSGFSPELVQGSE